MPKERRALCIGTLLLACFLLAGCVSGPHGAKGGKIVKQPAAELESAEEVERRIAAHAHFATGLHYDLTERPELALEEYVQAALANPAYEPLTLDVARRLMRERKVDRAIDLLKQSAAQPSASGAVDAWLGLAYAQQGQTNLAIASNKRAIKKLPTHIAAYQNLSSLYFQAGQTNLALKVLSDAAKEEAADADFYLGLSGLYTRYGELKALSNDVVRAASIKLLDRAAATDISDPLQLMRLADSYAFHGERQKAEPLYLRVLAEAPDMPMLREKLADLYMKLGDDNKAATQLESLIRNTPTDPQLYLIAASIALRQNDYPKASSLLETALKLRPQMEPLYYELAGVKLNLRQPDEAIALMEAARKRFGSTFPIEYYTGVAHGIAERFPEALRHLTAAELLAKTTDPSRLTAGFYFQLGSMSERAKDYEAAERHFRKCLELGPDNPEALNYLGYMWAERGVNLQEAHEMIAKAVKAEPENAAFLDSLAWVLFKMGKPHEALEPMLKAVEHSSEEPDATLFDHLGDIYLAVGQKDKARDSWERAVKIEPSAEIKAKMEKATPSVGQAP